MMMKKPEIQEPTKTMNAARQWLADNSAGAACEFGPVGAELKFHGNSSDDAENEVDGEYPGPESRGLVVPFVSSGQTDRLEDDDEQRQSHSELGKEIVERHREGKVDSVEEEYIHDGDEFTCLSSVRV